MKIRIPAEFLKLFLKGALEGVKLNLLVSSSSNTSKCIATFLCLGNWEKEIYAPRRSRKLGMNIAYIEFLYSLLWVQFIKKRRSIYG